MLEMILAHLNNWFEIPGAAKGGAFAVSGGELDVDFLQRGQYCEIRGSVFGDGLHRFGDGGLQDERFTGRVIPLAIPRAVLELAEQVEAWMEANPATDKISESFGGYSYTRASGSTGTACGWQAAFAPQLRQWKKVCRE